MKTPKPPQRPEGCADPKAWYYGTYLKSAHWNVVRAKAMIRAGGMCTKCRVTTELKGHHLNYDCLGKETAKDVVLLCDACHRKEHRLRPPPERAPNEDWTGRANGDAGPDYGKEMMAERERKRRARLGQLTSESG